MGFCNQFRALLKKNLILWYRNIIASGCEIIFPLIMVAVIVIVRKTIPSDIYPQQTYLDGKSRHPYYVNYDLQYNASKLYQASISQANPFSSCVSFGRYIFGYVGSSWLYPEMQKKLEQERKVDM
jgi:hypothetical protein